MTTSAAPALTDEAIVRFLSGLWHLNRRIKHDLQPLLETYGLDVRRYFILVAIRQGTVYPKELSEKLQIPSTLLSRYIDQLVQLQFLERQIDPHDSRRTRLNPTPAGEQVLQDAAAAIKAHTSQRLRAIDPGRLLVMLDTMQELGDTTPPAQKPPPQKPTSKSQEKKE